MHKNLKIKKKVCELNFMNDVLMCVSENKRENKKDVRCCKSVLARRVE